MLRYDLDRLGWNDFEHLIKTLLKAKLASGIEISSSLHDGGKEASYQGTLAYPDSSKPSTGSFCFQAKFVENAGAPGAHGPEALAVHIQKESAAIEERLNGKRHYRWWQPPTHYILFTNVDLNATWSRKIREILQAVMPKTEIYIHNGSDICAWIDSVPDITIRFPQLFSMADFTGLLRSEIRRESQQRSEIALGLAKKIAAAFVATRPYHRALQVLHNHFFVVLEGPPEMGKTSIARMLALAHFRDGWEAIECIHPKEIIKYLEEKTDTPQIFLADDCFGSTDYRADRVGDWQQHLPYILHRLDQKHLLVLTCRAHLWERAKPHLARGGQPNDFPQIGEVVVNAAELPQSDKARILYRHAKQANLSDEIKKAVKSVAVNIVKNPHFTPDRVRILIHELAKKTV